MTRPLIAVFTASLAASAAVTPATGQDALLRQCSQLVATSPQGAVPAEVQDQFRFMCGQVVQTMTSVQPTVGIAFSGGAHTLGTATTIGRRLGLFPRVSATARANLALADVPDLLDGYVARIDQDGRLRPMGTVGIPMGAFQGDVVLGVYNGVSLAPMLGGFGAIDLLGSVSFVPTVSALGMSDPIVNWGLGARVGLLRQGLLVPGVSVSAMYRTMTGDIAFGELGPDPAAGDPAEFSAGLSSWTFRGGVSKGFLILDLAAGVGYDIYRSDAHFDWRLRCPPEVCGQEMILETEQGVQGRLRTAAWNAYGNIGLNFLVARIVGEVGYQRPLDIVDADALQAAGLPAQPSVAEELGGGRFFLGLGVRLTL